MITALDSIANRLARENAAVVKRAKNKNNVKPIKASIHTLAAPSKSEKLRKWTETSSWNKKAVWSHLLHLNISNLAFANPKKVPIWVAKEIAHSTNHHQNNEMTQKDWETAELVPYWSYFDMALMQLASPAAAAVACLPTIIESARKWKCEPTVPLTRVPRLPPLCSKTLAKGKVNKTEARHFANIHSIC